MASEYHTEICMFLDISDAIQNLNHFAIRQTFINQIQDLSGIWIPTVLCIIYVCSSKDLVHTIFLQCIFIKISKK